MIHIDHLAPGKEVHQQDTFSIPEDHCCNFAYRVECFELLYWQEVCQCSWCVIWCIQVALPVTFCFRITLLVDFCWIRCCKCQPICKHVP
jgi:hypothetical protein